MRSLIDLLLVIVKIYQSLPPKVRLSDLCYIIIIVAFKKKKRGVDADFESIAIKYITFVSDMVQYPSAGMIYLDHTALYFLIDAVFFNRLKIFFIMFFRKKWEKN